MNTNESESLIAFLQQDDGEGPDLPSFSRCAGEHIETANIATDLKTRVAVGNKTRIEIIGSDCKNINDPSYTFWRELLKEWLTKNCQIDYLLVEPSENALQAFRMIAGDFPKDQMRIFVCRAQDTSDKRNKELIESWRTFHFAVFDNPKQMWVETSHPPDSVKAFDCYFFNEQRAKNLPIWDVYRAQFERVRDTACCTAI